MSKEGNAALANAAGGDADGEGEHLEEGTGGEEGGREGNDGPSDEVIGQAREMGWVPKDKFKGNPDVWVDADEFVRKGQEVLPIIRASNRRLSEQLQARDQENETLKTQLSELQESVSAMQEIQNREAVGRVDRQIKATRRLIEEARNEKDTDRVVELQETLDALEGEKEQLGTATEGKAGKRGKKDDDDEGDEGRGGPSAAVRQELNDWQEENPWYGEDEVRTSIADGISVKLRREPKWRNVVGKKFLDELARRTEEVVENNLGSSAGRKVGKTVGGSNGTRGSGSQVTKGKSYKDLPADAKAACDSDAKRLVGPNKAFKKAEDYQAFYVKEYFGE